MKQPHKHADLIHAWADGAEIQIKSVVDGDWFDSPYPTWAERFEYRIKPEPKPDVVRYAITTDTFVEMCPTGCACGQAAIKLTFDGETLELKAVEMIGER
jgi:hypothetical protein